MLVIEGQGKLKVSLFNSEACEMEEYGWVDAKEIAGWTLMLNDWDRTIRNRIQSGKCE